MSKSTINTIQNLSANKLVTLYLMSSYLYYIHDMHPIPDEVYDEICRQLLRKFKDIDHHHGHLITKEALKAGTAYHMREAHYPIIVQTAAFALSDKGAHIVLGFTSRRRRKPASAQVTETFISNIKRRCKI